MHVNITFPRFPAALAILCRLTPLFSRLRSRLCLRALTQSRWLGKPVKNLSPVNATFEAPTTHPHPLYSFLPPHPSLKFITKLFFAKYPVNSIKVISSPPATPPHLTTRARKDNSAKFRELVRYLEECFTATMCDMKSESRRHSRRG